MATDDCNEKALSPEEIHKLGVIFAESAIVSISIKRLAHSIADADSGGGSGGVTVADLGEILGNLAAKVGWMADLGEKILTGTKGINAGAEHWFMPDRYLYGPEMTEGVSHD